MSNRGKEECPLFRELACTVLLALLCSGCAEWKWRYQPDPPLRRTPVFLKEFMPEILSDLEQAIKGMMTAATERTREQ